MHPVELYMRLHYVLYAIYEVTGHLSEGSFIRNVVVQIPKFDDKPYDDNPNLNSNPNPSPIPNLYVSKKWPFGQVNCYRFMMLYYDAVFVGDVSFCITYQATPT